MVCLWPVFGFTFSIYLCTCYILCVYFWFADDTVYGLSRRFETTLIIVLWLLKDEHSSNKRYLFPFYPDSCLSRQRVKPVGISKKDVSIQVSRSCLFVCFVWSAFSGLQIFVFADLCKQFLNRPFPNCLWPLFQSEAWCTTFRMQIVVIWM